MRRPGGPGRRRGLVIGALDETSQQKQGRGTAGVQRQYLGCVGKVANGITTVHLAYVREHAGHTLIGARQWIPQAQIERPGEIPAHGAATRPGFRTKGQLAIDISTEAFADEVRLDFFCGDEVYGSCTAAAGVLRRTQPGVCAAGPVQLLPHAGSRGHVNLRGCGHPAAE